MNLCAPELGELGEIKLSKLPSPPGRLEGDRGIAPDRIRVMLHPIHAELQAVSLWALPSKGGHGGFLASKLCVPAQEDGVRS